MHSLWRRHWFATLIVAGLVLGTMVPIAMTITPFETAEASTHKLVYATNATWQQPVDLDGATLSGKVYPFVTPDFDVDDVEFYLDEQHVRSEGNPPFDFGGGSTRSADPWDTTKVPDGEHAITAILTMNDGSQTTLSATFTVANNAQNNPGDQPSDNGFQILYSTSSNRAQPANLHGATVSGQIFAFTTPDNGVRSVDFFLDDRLFWHETNAPFDFASGTVDSAKPWNTASVGDGQHTIRAVLNTSAGARSVSATFTVANNGGGNPQPTATNTPQPTAEPPATNTPAPTDTANPTEPDDNPGAPGHSLVYSVASNWSNPAGLGGATVSGNVYVYVTPTSGVDSVVFHLNGKRAQSEGNPPFDFAGGSTNAANPWDTTRVANGQHTIRAVLTMNDGTTQELTATFTVANGNNGGGGGGDPEPPDDGNPDPPDDPEPSPLPGDATTAGAISLAATYESISVYANYGGDGNRNNTTKLEWRPAGGGAWRSGMEMMAARGSQSGQWRASVLGLQPGTAYEVRVTFSDIDGVNGSGAASATITTRSDNYPVGAGQTYYAAPNGNDNNNGSQSSPFRTLQRAVDQLQPGDTLIVRGGQYASFDLTRSGTASAFIDIRAAQGETPVISSNNEETLVQIEARYVRFMGFELSGGEYGIRVDEPSQHVIIDGNFIHDQIHTGDTAGPVTIGDSFSSQNSVANITFQNNVVHAVEADPAQAAVYVKGSSGGHVIRNNEVYFFHEGTNGKHGTDCFGGGPNKQSHGGFHRDTDVYNNYCEGSTDDAISADGGGMNVRIWGNVSTGSQTGLSIAPVLLGPVYYFRNVTYDQQVQWTDKCIGVKTGEDSPGTSYLYHNVWVTSNSGPCGGRIHGFSNDGGGSSGTVIARNNIIHVTARIYSGSGVHGDHNLHFSEMSGGFGWPLYDCCGSSAGSLEEFQDDTGREQGSLWGRPSYASADGHNYGLSANSIGVNDGVVIPGFNTAGTPWAYKGSAPDMGAAER